MTDNSLQVAIIIGSVRGGRFGPTAAHWVAARAVAHTGLAVDVIDLLDHQLPLVMPAQDRPLPEDVAAVHAALGKRLAAAEAFIVVTPEYNHTPPAALKNFIDWFVGEWAAKPVAFVSYGGMSGGLRAVEHLRQTFSALQTVAVRESLSFRYPWETFDGAEPLDADAAESAAKTMLDRLVWWAEALRAARALRPFEA